MANLKKIKEKIRKIAGSRKNTTIDQLEWVVTQLGQNGFKVSSRQAGDHQTLFTIEHQTVGIATHKNGSKQLKPCYVDDFLSAMSEIDLYE